ncbi:MAG: PEP/pyruvate-binding domain-containing protein, partial [Myxococcales bacterium]
MSHIAWFENLSRNDVAIAGGKGANLGELTRAGFPVPPGFVLTADGFRAFVEANSLHERIEAELKGLDADDTPALERASAAIRKLIDEGTFPEAIRAELFEGYAELERRMGRSPLLVAVRSSATLEDTADFSFAGMLRSYLNARGGEDLVAKVRGCWASLFGPRVLFYRVKQGLTGAEHAVAVVVQAMVDSEQSGVLFTVDPSTGNRDVVVIESAWGLGEVVVGGEVEPDHYVVEKSSAAIIERSLGRKEIELARDPRSGENVERRLSPERAGASSLTDEQVKAIAELAVRDEAHYGVPQDGEFAIERGRIFLVQTRPVTTLRRPRREAEAVEEKGEKVLVRGHPASPGVAIGTVRVLGSPEEGARLQRGEILVTHMTTPDWVPLMRRAAAIVTEGGGMTSHAAIVSRELGLPCVVGTRNATEVLVDGMEVTVDAREGVVLRGRVKRAERPRAEQAAPRE